MEVGSHCVTKKYLTRNEVMQCLGRSEKKSEKEDDST